MNNEFKKISKDDVTRYVLESASGGGTSAGNVASVSKAMGGVQSRSNLLVQDTSQSLTPRSPVAHAAQKVAKGSGKHTDRKQQSKQVRGEKHKTKDFAENQDHEISMAGSELHSIFQNAKQLHTMIKTKSEEEGLDAWQQSKITKAADYLNSVLQSLQHEMMGEGDRTMSRAAKGMMKYGKDGMKALAKAGRDGASEKQLDTIRDKHDHYNEGWSQKYKNSINCSHPKGFSQRAHCAGKRKHNESIEMEMTCPDCGMCETHGDNMMEVKQRLDAKCWKGKHKEGTKIKGGIRVNNCVPNESIQESEKRCMQCGMTNCSCPPGKCKCKPIAGWMPGKGFKKDVAEATGDERFDSMMSQITGGTGARQGVDNLNKSLTARSGSNPETALAKWGQEFIKWLEDICRNFSRQGVDRFSKLEKLSEFEDGGETMAHWLIEVAKQTKTSGITLADIQEFSSEFNTYGMWPWQQFPIAWSQGEWQDYKDQWTGPDGYIASLRQGVAEGLISSGDAALELLELNIFKDLIGEHSLSNYDEEFSQSPKWQKVVAKWAPKAEGLYNAIIRLHNLGKKISSQEARAITDTAYDGSDAYNDPESAASDLPRIYAQQYNAILQFIENLSNPKPNTIHEQGVAETQLAELDRPSGKLFIIVKADNAGATHVFGDFGSFPQDVMHKISKRGTRDKSGAKTKLKIDFLFDNFRSTIQQLRTIFRDVDFVGAEAAEFIIHSSALRSDQGEDVKQLKDYIEAGDDRRMTMYQKPEEDDDGDDGETTGGNMLRIDPETGAARKVVGVKPQTQMGGKSVEQPGMTTYRFKDPVFARQLRGMNLGFNIKNDSITVDQKQKQELLRKLGNKFDDIFTSQERFKEDDINELRDMGDKPTDGELLLLMRKYRMAKVKGQDPYSVMRREEMFKLLDNEDRVKELKHRTTIENTLSEKAVSQQQQKFFGMVHAMQKGKKIPGASAELKKTAKDMSKSDAKDFAKTRHAGLPKKVSEFKMALPPTGMSPEEAQKFAADQQARSQAMYQQQQQQQTQQALPLGAIPGRNSPHPKTHVYDEKLDAWIPGAPLAPANEDSYMESLSAALEQKLSVNDTPEVWRDDFEHADPVKYPQFRNKTVEKKHRMADVARYRQIQKT